MCDHNYYERHKTCVYLERDNGCLDNATGCYYEAALLSSKLTFLLPLSPTLSSPVPPRRTCEFHPDDSFVDSLIDSSKKRSLI